MSKRYPPRGAAIGSTLYLATLRISFNSSNDPEYDG